ncbi:histamine H3 receptor-like [Diadema antillarum]|uniref:histamine H3 receptor-like n=1 Tax=Diadema antillarum TaxID=105358 RepID=UPI003A84AE40
MAGESEMGNFSSSYDYEDEILHSLAWLSIVPLIMSIIVAVTIIGNLMVVLAYIRDRRIKQNVANVLIVNLAVADLLVGALIMSINIHWVLAGYWAFGEIFCKFWSSMDHILSMMSIQSMLLISWDRYCLMTMGMRYKTYQTKRRLGLYISLCWVICLSVYFSLIFGWTAVTGRTDIDYSEECEPEFSVNLTATLIVLVLEFVVPVTILILLNVAVYVNIKRRSKGVVGQSPPNATTISRRIDSQRRDHVDEYPHNVPTQEERAAPRFVQESTVGASTGGTLEGTVQESSGEGPSRDVATGNADQQERRSFAKHRKAAMVLALLVSCFLLCYLPYHIASISFALCKFGCVTELTWDVSAMLVWCNSTLNPFIYAATNVHFRRNFRRFLLLDRWSCHSGKCRIKGRNEIMSVTSVIPQSTQ